jgi:putative membrane protein
MMKGWLFRWLLSIFVIILASFVVEGFNVTPLGAVVGSIVLGFVNAFIRPVILLLTLPLNVVTLGLFTLVINGLLLWFTSALIKGFDVTGFGTAFLAALIISIFSFVFNMFIKD